MIDLCHHHIKNCRYHFKNHQFDFIITSTSNHFHNLNQAMFYNAEYWPNAKYYFQTWLNRFDTIQFPFWSKHNPKTLSLKHKRRRFLGSHIPWIFEWMLLRHTSRVSSPFTISFLKHIITLTKRGIIGV